MRARVAAAALACAIGCGGEAGPDSGGGLAAVVVSDPVPLGARQVVYVSLPSGSVPPASGASVTNLRTGGTVSLAVEDGGWKPAELEAEGGDSIAIRVEALGLAAARVVPEATQPVIVRVEPPRGKRDVPLNARIYIAFSEPLDPATVAGGSVTLIRDGTPVPAQVALAPGGLALTIDPDVDLAPNTEYVISAAGPARDLDGDELLAATSSFTTGSTTMAEVPDLRLEPSAADFGLEWIGGPGRDRDFLVWNIGLGGSASLAASVTGPAAADFEIGADGCTGRVLVPFEQCTVRVTFRPTGAGGRIAVLWIGNVSAVLNGTGEAARLDLAPGGLDFGTVMTGGPAEVTSLVVSNSGFERSNPLQVLVLAPCTNELRVLEACTTPFTLAEDRCSGFALEPGAACVLRIAFEPGIVTRYAAQLLVYARATSRADLLGDAAGLTSGTSTTQPLLIAPGGTGTSALIRNTGPQRTGPISGPTDVPGFRIVNDGCDGTMLEPGASCAIAIRYTPTTPGRTATGRMSLHASPGGTTVLYLHGKAN